MPEEPDRGMAQRRAVMDPVFANPARVLSPADEASKSGVFRSAELTESAVLFMKQQPSEVNTAARLLKVWVRSLQARGLLRQQLKPLSFVAEMLAVCGYTRIMAEGGRATASLAAIVKEAMQVAVGLAAPGRFFRVQLTPSYIESLEHTGGLYLYQQRAAVMMPRTQFYKVADLEQLQHCWGGAGAVLLHPVDPTDNLLEGEGWAEGGLEQLGREAERVLAVMEVRSLGELMESSSLGLAYRDHCAATRVQ